MDYVFLSFLTGFLNPFAILPAIYFVFRPKGWDRVSSVCAALALASVLLRLKFDPVATVAGIVPQNLFDVLGILILCAIGNAIGKYRQPREA